MSLQNRCHIWHPTISDFSVSLNQILLHFWAAGMTAFYVHYLRTLVDLATKTFPRLTTGKFISVAVFFQIHETCIKVRHKSWEKLKILTDLTVSARGLSPLLPV